MTCPRCSSELKPTRREDVEIDVCPQCRGIWLDAGELERLTKAEEAYNQRDDNGADDGEGGHGEGGKGGHGEGGKGGDGEGGKGGRGKKRGFFQNLFDNIGDFGD